MRKGNTSTLVRRNITLPDDFSKRMTAIREAAGIQSDSELIRRAVTLLEKVLDEKGKSLVLRDNKTGKEEKLLVL
ncbi:MAG TPA: ribbon-helix-helix protein, CopG family [Pseudorhodoplanes sp.]|nr:ribbon-helix-helix protein, CopG family [Pseudorhodoplanes sp.]